MMDKKYLIKCIFIFFIICNYTTYAQLTKVRPNTSSDNNGLLNGNNAVRDRGRAHDQDVLSFAEVRSQAGVLLGIGSFQGELVMVHNTPVPANTKYFLKIESSGGNALLGTLLGGSLGATLSDVLGLVALGNHYMRVEAFNGTINVLNTNRIFNGSTNSAYSNTIDRMRIVNDVEGNFYIMLKLPSQFDRIRFTDQNISLVGLDVNADYTRIFDTYYNTGNAICQDILTYYDMGGISLDVLNAGSGGVINPINAFDNDLTTFSQMNIGAVGLGAYVYQSFLLSSPVINKDLQIRLQMPEGLLGLDIGQGVFIEAYNNGQIVYTQQINDEFIGVNLLGLINTSNGVSVRFSPQDINGNAIQFDEYRVRLSSPVSLNVGTSIKIFDAAVVDKLPNTTVTVCTVDNVFDLTQYIPNYNVANEYSFITYDGEVIEDPTSVSVGAYLIKGVQTTGVCPNSYYYIIANEDQSLKINGKGSIGVYVGESFDFSTLNYTHNLPNGSSVKIYDESNNVEVTNATIVFDEIGTNNYYAKTINNDNSCEIIKKIKVFVYAEETCDYRYVMKQANHVTDWGTVSLLGIPLGSISDRPRAGDNDLSTHSTITNIISLVGIGTTYQDLKFRNDNTSTLEIIPAGTPITVKLGQDYSLLQIIGAITLRTIDGNGNVIGNFIDVGESDLLNALVGDNVFEFTYIPKDNYGNPIEYTGVRIHLGSVLGVGNSMNVFGAYIDQRVPVENSVCEPDTILNGAAIPNNLNGTVVLNKSVADVFWGVEDIGIGAGTALSGVVYPYLAADNNFDTFAYINQAASLLNSQSLTVKFKEIARPGDKVRVIMGKEEVGILNLNVLGGFTAQRFLGDIPIGDPLTPADFSVLDINLLGLLGTNNNYKFSFVMNESLEPFDRITLRFTNIVNVQLLGDYPKIFDVSLVPYLDFEAFEQGGTLCVNKKLVVEKLDQCTTYQLSFAYASFGDSDEIVSWNDISGSQFTLINTSDQYEYDIPNSPELFDEYTNLAQDENLYLKIVTMRQNCQYGDVQYIKVSNILSCTSKSISNPMIRSRLKSN